MLWSLVLKLPKEKASLKVRVAKPKFEDQRLELKKLDLSECGCVVVTAVAVTAKVIRIACDEVSGSIESTEAVVRDRAIPSSSLSTLLLVVGS